MEITLLKQDKPMNCGQTAIAMVTGKTIREVEAAFADTGASGGSRGGATYGGAQVAVLQSFGVKCGSYVVVAPTRDWSVLPKTALVRFGYLKKSGGHLSKTKTKSMGHLVVWHDGKFYDPAGAVLTPDEVRHDVVMTRFLAIER